MEERCSHQNLIGKRRSVDPMLQEENGSEPEKEVESILHVGQVGSYRGEKLAIVERKRGLRETKGKRSSLSGSSSWEWSQAKVF